jgi:hypothetical protein
MLAWAVVTELRKPREQRTWHGHLADVVPYDFRPPTLGRVRERWWNPADPRLLTPHVFGVGWSINLARAMDLLRDRRMHRTSGTTPGNETEPLPSEPPRPD